MKIRNILIVLCAMSAPSFNVAIAAKKECLIMYDRTACPGKEKISYKKCKGEKTCEKKKKAKDMAACQKMAEKSCSNSRLDITKSKMIKAKFDGQPIKSPSGSDNFCAADREDFNKCSS